MALMNEGASFPSYMWALVRLLLTSGGKADSETARRLLTPPTLPAGETDEFDNAVRSLADLGVVTKVDGIVELAAAARALSPGDVTAFNGLLRGAALDPARNEGIAERPDADGPKDLIRALAWFLTQDPFEPLDLVAVSKLQDGVFASDLPAPIVNDFRWSRFVYWAPALGFAARPLLDQGGSVRLVPDCTVAVRETALALWEKEQSVNASEVINRITEALPVLPGGVYSRLLGLGIPDGEVPACLSNALLIGEEDGWIKPGRQSDADDIISLADGSGANVRVTEFTINGSS
jgi:hypothetical protein